MFRQQITVVFGGDLTIYLQNTQGYQTSEEKNLKLWKWKILSTVAYIIFIILGILCPFCIISSRSGRGSGRCSWNGDARGGKGAVLMVRKGDGGEVKRKYVIATVQVHSIYLSFWNLILYRTPTL